MTRFALIVSIGATKLPSIELFSDGDSAYRVSKIVSKSVDVSFESVDKKPFIHLSILNEASSIVYDKSFRLQRRASLSAFIDMILYKVIPCTKKCHFDLIISNKGGGLALGVLSSYYMDVTVKIQNKVSVTQEKSYHEESKKDCADELLAKTEFISHIDSFAFLLPLTYQLRNGSKLAVDELKASWIEKIKSVRNTEHLLVLFEESFSNPSFWLTLLESWGIKHDGCKYYYGSTIDKKKYNLKGIYGSAPANKYEVIAPYWSVWLYNNGQKEERVLIKGDLQVLENGE